MYYLYKAKVGDLGGKGNYSRMLQLLFECKKDFLLKVIS